MFLTGLDHPQGVQSSEAPEASLETTARNSPMKAILIGKRPGERPRLSLEQKVRLMVRRYRAAEKRRKRKEAARFWRQIP